MTKRDPFFDLLKFIAMFMVVYLHVMSYRPGFNLATTPSRTANFIISMNMPLFFIISGYFSRRLHESGDWKKLCKRLVTYFWPLSMISFLIACAEAVIWHRYSMIQIPLATLKSFLFNGWFFYSLAICEVGTFLAYRSRSKRSGIVLVCFAFFLLLLVSSGKVWYTSYTVAMIGFYWFGMACLPRIFENVKLFSVLSGLSAVVVISSQVAMDNIATNGLAFYWDRIDVWNFQWMSVVNQINRLFLGVAGSLLIMGVVKVMMMAIPSVSHLAYLGTQTLWIYCIHGFFVNHFSNKYVSLSAGLGSLVVSTILIYFVCVCMIAIAKRYSLWGKLNKHAIKWISFFSDRLGFRW